MKVLDPPVFVNSVRVVDSDTKCDRESHRVILCGAGVCSPGLCENKRAVAVAPHSQQKTFPSSVYVRDVLCKNVVNWF